MEFLPTTDLESASQVNTTWQMEALKYLIVKNPINIQLNSNVNDSNDLVTLSNLSPTNLKIVNCRSDNLENLLSKIDLLTSLNLKPATKLSLEVPLDSRLHHVASHLVKIVQPLKTLRSLELYPHLSSWYQVIPALPEWEDIFPENFSYPGSLTNLTVNMTRIYPDSSRKWGPVIAMATRILTVFCHVRHLSMTDLPGGLIQQKNINLPQLESISLQRTLTTVPVRNETVVSLFKFNLPLKNSFAHVTRLEFNVLLHHHVETVNLLPLLAPQLEHVCISGVPNVVPKCPPQRKFVITVPILPKLKVFEIFREQTVGNRRIVRIQPHLYLDFETGGNQVKFSYAKQFPVLERLIVRVVHEIMPKWMEKYYKRPDANLHFEATMLFCMKPSWLRVSNRVGL